MDDREIIRLYFERDGDAVKETAEKYGEYCRGIARNILGVEDAEECVNDTYLSAWNSIPPNKPEILSAYLGRMTRNIAFDRYRKNRAAKRGGGQIDSVLEELSQCVSAENSVEDETDANELKEHIRAFLKTLPKKKRNIFLCRYWYACPVKEIAEKTGMNESAVSVTLSRIREKLKKYLSERGYDI